MIVVLHIVVLCRFTLRSYAANVVPASYAWSTFTGPVSGEVQEVKPWKPSSSSSTFPGFESSNDESNSYASDYVAKPQYSFAYGVENPNTGESHGHSETRDGAKVTGEYSVMEPDGVLRRVQYTADPENGFRASVRYVRPDGEETPSRDHGYHQGGQNRVPASRPSSSSSSLFAAGYGSTDDDEDGGGGGGGVAVAAVAVGGPFNVAAPQTSEYEADGGDEPFAALPSPLPLRFGFDKYNGIGNHLANGGNDDDDDDDDNSNIGDYRDDNGPLTFKFPSSSSQTGAFFKGSAANAADADDYGDGDKYRQWGGFGSPASPFDDRPVAFGLGPPSSPAPFSLASSLSPSFDVAPPRSQQQQQYGAFPRQQQRPRSPFAESPPCRAPTGGASLLPLALRSNVINFRTNHPPTDLFGKRPDTAADDDEDDHNHHQYHHQPPDRFRSAQVDIAIPGDDDDNEDVENYESDDSDTDNAQHVTDVQVSPSSSAAKSQPPPPPQPLAKSHTPATPQPSAAPTQQSSTPPAPSSFHRPSSQPVAVQQDPPPSPAAVTPVVVLPTAVDD